MATLFALSSDVRLQGESVVFADQVIKLNRRSQPERRDFVITDRAIYLVMRKKRQGQVIHSNCDLCFSSLMMLRRCK